MSLDGGSKTQFDSIFKPNLKKARNYMIISQTRINGTSKFRNIQNGQKVRIVLHNPEDKVLEKMGFGKEKRLGDTILPSVIGPATRFNAEGKYIKHYDKEKEDYTIMREWTYQQFCGRGETREVTDSVCDTRKRYQRTLVPPNSIELTIEKLDSDLALVSPEFTYGSDNDEIITVVNIFLEYFGTCEILIDGKKSVFSGEVKRLNWDVLPKGEYPWEVQKQRIKPFLEKSKGTNRKVIDKRQETINGYQPDFTAIGSGGFSGYIVHGFTDKSLYVLESVQVNNATYILSKNWEEISKLTKAEIIRDDLHEQRVIHNKNWYKLIKEYLNA